MDRSLSFGSATTNLSHFRTRFRYGSWYHPLNLASHHNRRLIMQKAVRHRSIWIRLRMIVGKWFQVLFTPLSAVLFTFPSRYLFTIDLGVVFSLGWWSTHIQSRFLVSRPTRKGVYLVSPTLFCLRDYHPLWLDFPTYSAIIWVT